MSGGGITRTTPASGSGSQVCSATSSQSSRRDARGHQSAAASYESQIRKYERRLLEIQQELAALNEYQTSQIRPLQLQMKPGVIDAALAAKIATVKADVTRQKTPLRNEEFELRGHVKRLNVERTKESDASRYLLLDAVARIESKVDQIIARMEANA